MSMNKMEKLIDLLVGCVARRGLRQLQSVVNQPDVVIHVTHRTLMQILLRLFAMNVNGLQ